MVKKVLFITLCVLLLVMPLLVGCSQTASPSVVQPVTTSTTQQPSTSIAQTSTTSATTQPAATSTPPQPPSSSVAQPSTTSTTAPPVNTSIPQTSASAQPTTKAPAPPVPGGKEPAPPPPPPPPKASSGPQPPEPPGPPPPLPIVDDPPYSSGKMIVTSPVVKEGGELGNKYTCNIFLTDSTDRPISPPVNWTGAPANTKSFALILWHTRGSGDEGIFFLVYNIPGTAKGLPEGIPPDSSDPKVGIVGKNTKSSTEYYSPCGGEAGIFKYNITVYALSAEPKLPSDPYKVDANVLRTAMKDITLDSATMSFIMNYKGS